MTGAVDVQILNRLLEHRNFPKLIDLIRIYFQDTAAKGITARNQLIEMATASLSDLMKEHPEHRAEAKQDLQLLNAQKMGEHEAEIEKIKNVFLAILRDIKKDIDNGEQPGEAVTAAMFQAMRDALAEQKQKPLSIDDVTAMIAGQIGQLTPMDKETVENAINYWTEAGYNIFNAEVKKLPEKPKYTVKELNELAQIAPDFEFMRTTVESILGKAMTLGNCQTLAWMYKDAGLDVSSIILIANYAKKANKPRIKYMENIVERMVESGITTYEETEKFITKLKRADNYHNKIKDFQNK